LVQIQNKIKFPIFYLPPQTLSKLTGLSELSQIYQQNTLGLQIATQHMTLASSALDSLRIGSILEYISPLTEIIKSWEIESTDDIEIFKDEKFRNIPFLFAGYLYEHEIYQLKQKWKDGDIEYVKKFILASLKKSEVQREMLARFEDDSALKKRKVLFEDALWAHNNCKYSLSIPILFPLIEGVLIDKYGHLFKEGKCSHCRTRFRASGPNIMKAMQSIYSKSDYIVVKKYAAKLEHLLQRFSIDRNPILHGLNVNYPSEELSAALILTVYSLDFIKIEN